MYRHLRMLFVASSPATYTPALSLWSTLTHRSRSLLITVLYYKVVQNKLHKIPLTCCMWLASLVESILHIIHMLKARKLKVLLLALDQKIRLYLPIHKDQERAQSFSPFWLHKHNECYTPHPMNNTALFCKNTKPNSTASILIGT